MADGADRIMGYAQAALEDCGLAESVSLSVTTSASSWEAALELPRGNQVGLIEGNSNGVSIHVEEPQVHLTLKQAVEIATAACEGARSKGWPEKDWKY